MCMRMRTYMCVCARGYCRLTQRVEEMSIQLKELTDLVKSALPGLSIHHSSGLMNGRDVRMEGDHATGDGRDEPEIVYLTAA